MFPGIKTFNLRIRILVSSAQFLILVMFFVDCSNKESIYRLLFVFFIIFYVIGEIELVNCGVAVALGPLVRPG